MPARPIRTPRLLAAAVCLAATLPLSASGFQLLDPQDSKPGADDSSGRSAEPIFEDNRFRPREAGTSPREPATSPESKARKEAQVSAQLVSDGKTATLRVEVRLPEDFYIYDIDPPSGPGTKITLTGTPGLEPVDDGFTPDHEPKVELQAGEGGRPEKAWKFYDQVTWTKAFRVIDAETAAVSLKIEGQYCASGPGGVCKRFAPAPTGTVRLDTEPVALTGNEPAAKFVEQPTEKRPFAVEESPKRGKGQSTVHVSLEPEDAKPGDKVTLSVRMEVAEGWHTFSNSMPPVLGAAPTRLTVDEVYGLQPLDDEFVTGSIPEFKTVEYGDKTVEHELHHGEVTWTREFEVQPGATAYGVTGAVRYQTCNENTCLTGLQVDYALGAVPVAESEGQGKGAAQVAGDEPADDEQVAEGGSVKDLAAQGLLPFLLAAVGFGFAALLTPCVFPMIPITVSVFLKQSEKEHHRPFVMAIVYCLGIVVTFTVIGLLMSALFGATEINELANNPWLNLLFAAVLVFFGLNMLGLFEIRVPSWLLNWSSGHQNRGGYVGVLFMAFTFTLVSFTCTFAFVGGLLVFASQGDYFWPTVGMLAFSSAFALPFFFLALFPSMLKKLPKSGGWMNTIKVTVGLIEVGAAFKFLSVTDLSLNPSPLFFDFAVVLSAWMVISAVIGLYLMGVFRLPHDTPTDTVSVTRLVFAMSFLGFAGYLATGLFSAQKPDGLVWQKIEAFVTPTFEGAEDVELGPVLVHDELEYALNYDRAVEYARETNRPLFLDFTGVNCVNCREMEKKFEQPRNRDLLEKFVRVQLYVDNVPQIEDRQLARKLLEQNRKLQENEFGDTSLPGYAVVTPDGETYLAKYVGAERETGDFAEFLQKGLQKWQRRTEQSKGGRSRLARRKRDATAYVEREGTKFALEFDRAAAEARRQNRPLIAVLTHVNSVYANMLETQLAHPEHRELLEQYVPVLVYVHMVPIVDESEEQRLVERNRQLRDEIFEADEHIPTCVVVTPDGERLATLQGLPTEPGQLTGLLERGLETWRHHVAEDHASDRTRVAAR